MSLYFFHIRHPDTFILDEEGAEFEDAESAKVEAQAGARDLAADYIRRGDSLIGVTIEVVDAKGKPLQTVSLISVTT
jgi:hypothetical protein